MEKTGFHLTEKQIEILRTLQAESKLIKVFTVEENQSALAKKLGITRQALNVHLRKLKEAGFIRTGRGFIDLTDKALEALGVRTAEAFVAVKIEPRARNQAYSRIKMLPVERVYRVTGDIDLLVVINQALLDDFLKQVSKIEGVKDTITYVVIERLA
ncbi:MAG: Lrp/AsnC family transcriptional regulator [Thermoproteales archaeon]|nr:Lrp/AsnC family transcriptional regulator [Thermoproteales archaeon]